MKFWRVPIVMDLPPLLPRAEIRRRLERIFPEGIDNRNYVIREIAASTVFVMLYLGAVEGAGYYIRPDQVVRMSDEQAARTNDDERLRWRNSSVSKGGSGGWCAKNTREPIRDETLRYGLVQLGAAVELTDVPTTSSKGRYALSEPFADLFRPGLAGEDLDEAISKWQRAALSASAQARLRLLQNAAVETRQGVLVRFPNGETRRLPPGPSSEITRAVAKEFAPRFLSHPGVLWVSESRTKETFRDAQLLRDLGIVIAVDRVLPDMILVDLGEAGEGPLFIFVEVVATDGPITTDRRKQLLTLITSAGYAEEQAAFVTAYLDRDHQAFRKTISSLAWGSCAWFLSEPDNLITMHSADRVERMRDLRF